MGPYHPMLELTIISHYLIVGSEVQVATPTSKGMGVKWGSSILLVEHIFICMSVNFHNMHVIYVIRKRENMLK
jgi:hypothetical protein